VLDEIVRTIILLQSPICSLSNQSAKQCSMLSS